METKILSLALLTFLFVAPFVSASGITRNLPDSASPGETISVTMDVAVTGGETYYLIDEKVPEGWVIVSGAEEGTEAGHLKWAVIQNAASTRYTYQVMAPQTEGTYTFSGKYMFEGMTTEGTIGGRNTVTVRAALKYETILVPFVIVSAVVLSFAIYKTKFGKRGK